MSTIEEALQATMAKRELDEKLAAAREEQREVCALQFAWRTGHEGDGIRSVIRATPLAATPLADTIKDLRADAVNAARVVAQLHEDMNNVADEDDRGHRLIDAADGEPPGEASVDTLATRVERLLAQRKKLTEERGEIAKEEERCQRMIDRATGQDPSTTSMEVLSTRLDALLAENAHFKAELKAVRAERDALRAAGVDLAKAFGKPK